METENAAVKTDVLLLFERADFCLKADHLKSDL